MEGTVVDTKANGGGSNGSGDNGMEEDYVNGERTIPCHPNILLPKHIRKALENGVGSNSFLDIFQETCKTDTIKEACTDSINERITVDIAKIGEEVMRGKMLANLLREVVTDEDNED